MKDLDSLEVQNSKTTKIFFSNLDALRFFAFMPVFFHHSGLGDILTQLWSNTIFLKIVAPFMSGGLGVSFFFVLSGYLITFLLLQEKENTGRIDVLKFYMRRVLRIWPLFYAVLIFGFVIYPTVISMVNLPYQANNDAWYSFFFLTNIDVINKNVIGLAPNISITWSVSIEEQFYLIWPLLFFIVPKKYYVYIFSIVIVSATLFRFIYADLPNTLYFHSFAVMSDLAIGGLVAYFVIDDKYKLRSIITQISTAKIIALYVIGFIFLISSYSLIFSTVHATYVRLIAAVFFAFVIIEQNYAQSSFFKGKNLKFCSKMGIISYGLYLLHPICIVVVHLVSRFFKNYYQDQDISILIIKLILSFCLTLFVAQISYNYFEKLFLSYKHKFQI